MEDRLVTLKKFDTAFGAQFAKDVLEENGIKAIVVGENLHVVPHLTVSCMDSIELKVFECDVDKAKEILTSQPDAETGDIDE